jgi:hypothetical protein
VREVYKQRHQQPTGSIPLRVYRNYLELTQNQQSAELIEFCGENSIPPASAFQKIQTNGDVSENHLKIRSALKSVYVAVSWQNVPD